MSQLVVREDNDGLVILTLNRPEALNALSPDLFLELREHIDVLSGEHDKAGVIILTGKGKAFSAGNDLKAMAAGQVLPSPYFQAETLEALEALPQPVISAVNGHCYTGALELVLATDITIAADTARFADTHGKFAMVPIWGMSQRLPRRVGLLKAREMMFSGRVVSGEEAARIGLANFCVPEKEMMDEAVKMARSFLKNSWHTLKFDKKLINTGQNHPFDEGMRIEREQSPGHGPDVMERMQAFSKK